MSVTFAISLNDIPVTGFVLSPSCEDEAVASVQFATYEECALALVAHRLVCTDCGAYGCYSQPVYADDYDEDLEVNLANMNARTVLTMLGLGEADDDLCGMADAEDFLGRVLTNLATLDTLVGASDRGTADVRDGNLVHCGLPAGYFERTLSNLALLAEEAKRQGRAITWS